MQDKNNPSTQCSCQPATRRSFIAGASAATLTGSANANEANERPKPGDVFVDIEDMTKSPLSAEKIKSGQPQIIAWPMEPATKTLRDGSRLNKVLLVRVDAAKMTEATKERTVDGIVAYSAICTHTGCDVLNWIEGRDVLECPCHNSIFDPHDGARVVDGPSPRPLPALPIKIIEGVLVAAGPFATRPGFTPG